VVDEEHGSLHAAIVARRERPGRQLVAPGWAHPAWTAPMRSARPAQCD